MKKSVVIILVLVLTISLFAQKNKPAGYPISPVPFTNVKVTDQFWGQRLKASQNLKMVISSFQKLLSK